MLRHVTFGLLVTPLVILAAASQTGERGIHTIPVVPLPSAAIEPTTRLDEASGRREISFALADEYPKHSARDFYDSWAATHGWERIQVDEELWSGDRWQSFRDATVDPVQSVDQWLVHWASPGREWSLRLALRYSRDLGSAEPRQLQQVHVIVEPFRILGK